jgi:hypothetical protein
VKALGRVTGSTRTADQTALAPFWEGNASVHWNQAANQMARANGLSLSDSNRLFAILNLAMADTAFTVWSAKRHYGALPGEVTWRPTTAVALAEADGNPDTVAESGWQPLVVPTPSHPEYPAGHPSQNGAAATILLGYFEDAQTFTLTLPAEPIRASRRRVLTAMTPRLGRDALSQHRSHQRCLGRSNRTLRGWAFSAARPWRIARAKTLSSAGGAQRRSMTATARPLI